MRLGFAALVLVIFALCVQQAKAHPTLIGWEQHDYAPGDTWEIVWDCEDPDGFQPLEPMWGSEGARVALVDPGLECTAIARTWRDGVVSEESEPVVYVLEPPMWMGLFAGLLCMKPLSRRAQGLPGI